MTINIHLLDTGRNTQRQAQFESHSQTYRLVVEECPVSQDQRQLYDATQVLEMLGTTGIGTYRVKQDSAFEVGSGSTWQPLTPPTEYGRWLCRSIAASTHPQKANTYIVEVQETNMGRMYVAEAPAEGDEESSGGYVGDLELSVNWTATGKQQQAWRGGDIEIATDEPGPMVSDFINQWCPKPWAFCTSAQDIKGSDIGFGMAQPIQLTTRQSQIQIEYIVRAPIHTFDGDFITPYVNSNNVSPYLALTSLEAMVGRRNWNPIGSYEPGYLLMSDVSVQPLHYEFKKVVLTLNYDEWKHAYQRPFVTKSGVVAGEFTCADIDEDIADGATEIINMGALYVGWLQPYLQAFTFGEDPDYLFNDGFMSEVFWKLMADPSTYANETAGECPE